MKVTLYTTHCPRCSVLEKKLKAKNVGFSEVSNVEIMKSKGFTNVPMLDVDGIVMDFISANEWVNSLEDTNGD